jgi:hypothetical protein
MMMKMKRRIPRLTMKMKRRIPRLTMKMKKSLRMTIKRKLRNVLEMIPT